MMTRAATCKGVLYDSSVPPEPQAGLTFSSSCLRTSSALSTSRSTSPSGILSTVPRKSAFGAQRRGGAWEERKKRRRRTLADRSAIVPYHHLMQMAEGKVQSPRKIILLRYRVMERSGRCRLLRLDDADDIGCAASRTSERSLAKTSKGGRGLGSGPWLARVENLHLGQIAT